MNPTNMEVLEQALDQGRDVKIGGSGKSKLTGWSPVIAPGADGVATPPLSLPPAAAAPASAAGAVDSTEAPLADAGTPAAPTGAGVAGAKGGRRGSSAGKTELSKKERKALWEAKNAGTRPPKKPKLTKKERREKQERERAAKEAAKAAGGTGRKGKKGAKGGAGKKGAGSAKGGAKSARRPSKLPGRAQRNMNEIPLFSHLSQYERQSSLLANVSFAKTEDVHPAVLRLGLKYSEGTICGANARCVAMLTVFKEMIRDYISPPDKAIAWDLDKKLRPQIDFLTKCRPHSFGMGTAIRYVRYAISHIPVDWTDDEAKHELEYKIDRFIEERIQVADEAIVSHLVVDGKKIVDGDVILTYARSHVVELALIKASELGIKFRVIVADGRPRLEGKELLRRLEHAGVDCTYIWLNGLSYVMKDVTKVVLGAAAMLSNGSALSRVGTGLVCTVATAYNKPVLFCCETYKFSQRVQIDSIVFNELGDPDELVATTVGAAQTGLPADSRSGSAAAGAGAGAGAGSGAGESTPSAAGGAVTGKAPLADWRDDPDLRLLNLVYDLTPIEQVALVVTETGMIPPTSVPVIIREQQLDAATVA